MKSLKRCFRIFVVLCAAMMAGCGGGSPQAIYYNLSTIVDSGAGPKPLAEQTDLAIGIGPVKFPDSLDRSSIVTSITDNRLKIDAVHRWGGSLEQAFNAVLVENIAYLLGTDQVVARPWGRYFKPDIGIAVDVHRLSGVLAEKATLRATWMIFDHETKTPFVTKTSTIDEPSRAATYDSLVAAQSRAVATLCKEISVAINALSQKK